MVSFRSLFEKCIQEHSVYKQKGEDTLSDISRNTSLMHILLPLI